MSDYVYKYRAFSKLHLQALLENKIWFSKSETFNDPFDSSHNTFSNKSDLHSVLRLMQKSDPSKAEYYQGIINSNSNQKMHFESHQLAETGEFKPETIEKKLPFKSMTTLLSDIYIFCACKSGINNLMWSHYADYHKGFCIRYRKADLEKLNLYKHKEVDYVHNRTNLPNELTGLGDATDSILNQSFIKGKDWEYEKEYRFIMQADVSYEDNPPSSIPILHNVEAVDMIIFGLKASESDRIFIKSLLFGRNIKFKDVQVSESGFKLNIKP